MWEGKSIALLLYHALNEQQILKEPQLCYRHIQNVWKYNFAGSMQIFLAGDLKVLCLTPTWFSSVCSRISTCMIYSL